MAAQPNERLAQVFGNLAVELQAQLGTSETLRSIVHAAADIVPGARWAGISLIEGRKVVSQVPTSPAVAELDQMQLDLVEGPCMTALREHHTVRIDDMGSETRWPAFAREAQQRGIRTLLSFQLFVRTENLGALNLYGDQPGGFTEESLVLGEVLAQPAAVAMVGVAGQAQFEKAVATRDIIGQAKGILMQRDQIAGLRAFNLLARASQSATMKLVDVARRLVDEHESKLEVHR